MSKKIVLFLSIFEILILSGCATTSSMWDQQRQRLTAAYQRGEVSGDTYYKELNDIEKNQLAERQRNTQVWQNAFQQMSQTNQSNAQTTDPSESFNQQRIKPRSGTIRNNNGEQVGYVD